MARRVDRPALSEPGERPRVEREFSAGGLVFRRARGRWKVVLGARRHPETGVLVWTIPKGHLEAGERSADAAVREVREETGLEAAIEAPLGDLTYWYARRDRGGRVVRMSKRVRLFLMRYRGGDFADRDDELDEVRWYDLARAAVVVAFENERKMICRAAELLAERETAGARPRGSGSEPRP